MPHPFFAAAATRVFAHRGGAGLAPENTIPAFDHGLSLGADGLELDVHLSRDGVVVVHHDRTLDRTTNLTGAIAERTASELARADAGYRFERGGDFPWRGRGAGVPALAEVLARHRDTPIIIELKENAPALAQAALDVVRRAGALERVCFGSFGLRVLRTIRASEPAAATSAAREEVRWALYRSWVHWPATRVGYDGYQVPEWAGRTRVLSPHFVASAHRAGLAVQAWTVDTEEDARRLIGWGIDAIITDRPDLVVSVCKPRR